MKNMKEQYSSLTRMLRMRSMRKLSLISLLIIVILAVVVFATVALLSTLWQADLLEHHLSTYPQIIDERVREIDARQMAYVQDYQIRADLGARLYEVHETHESHDEDGADAHGRLETVRDIISASCIALCDRSGKLLEITDPEEGAVLTPDLLRQLREETVSAYIMDEETYDYVDNPRFFVLRASPVTENQDLIFFFDCSPLARISEEIGEWDDVLERVLSGTYFTAYLRDNATGDLGRYPHYSLSEEESERLKQDVEALFSDEDGSAAPDEQLGPKLGTFWLLDDLVLAVTQSFPEHQDVSISLTVSSRGFVRQTMLRVLAIIMISALGLILFMVYSMRRMKNVAFSDDKKERCRKARRLTLPGLVILLSVTIVFIVMIMGLESKSRTANTIIGQRVALRSEISYHNTQSELLKTELPGMVRIRADALAHILSDNPQLRTRENLKQFCEVVQADCLMLFDKNGREICASNTYTGFTVSEDESDPSYVFRPLLMGYSSVVTDPEVDEITGEMLYAVGSLIVDSEGLPDGFILIEQGADELSSLLDSLTEEQTVNRFATLKGQMVALADEVSGRFVAHTDPGMIGEPVSSVMKDTFLGNSFEGFANYDGKNVYLSTSSENGKTLMVLYQGDRSKLLFSDILAVAVMVLAVLLLFGLVFFRSAASMISKTEYDAEDDGEPESRAMLGIFAHGYGIFMVVFSIVTAVAAKNGIWSAFDYVYDGNWSRGVHLFSLWTALFILADGFYLTSLLHLLLSMLDSYSDQRTKTVMRLVDSLVTYTAVILLIGYTMYIFGVNTAAMLASAGIVSIAVGMGSRDLITDILAGVFMLLEGSLHVGDTVQIGGWEGCVTDMGIRTTRITNADGEVKILNNSRINEVVNKSTGAQA